MSEGPPKQPSPDIEAQAGPERTPRERYVELAKELAERGEHFPFPGIDSEAYPGIKAAEAEYPGYTTPIDDLIERFKTEGVKVVLGKFPESGNVFILPGQSNDTENDAIPPRQLDVSEGMDERLKELILANRGQT